MALETGSRIGPYEIGSRIGEGGMGEVYRAKDSNLGRSVAIKVLPEAFAKDADRLARFEREAKTLASLNHPNIAQVFGLEKGSGGQATYALVMELVEGPTLADRIAGGPIAFDEAVPIAIQIAEALESAHDAGIIHRDLKPANIKVRPDGTVKVLDFGLAKALDQGSGIRDQGSANTLPPTITSPAMTQAGMILGTAAYMSPEQAKGRAVDRRADVWAFGCVFFEMLSGKRAFAGDDISDVLVSVLRDDPVWSALPPDTPPHIHALLRRCLLKDPKKRLPHIGGARLELSEAPPSEGFSTSPPSRPRRAIGLGVASGLIVGAVIAIVGTLALRPETPASPAGSIRFLVTPTAGQVFPGANGVPRFAVSPDGTHVVYESSLSGKGAQLWTRRLDAIEAQPVPGTESASDFAIGQPFFSPDGKVIAYIDESTATLRRVDARGGVVVPVCEVSGQQFGGSWNAADQILFGTTLSAGIQQVTAGGGKPAAVTSIDRSRGEQSHLFPQWLPDGRHFVYLATRTEGPGALFVGSLDGSQPKHLLDSPVQARFAPPNWLLYMRGDQLVAQALDLERFQVVGPLHTVADGVLNTSAGRSGFSVSTGGVLVYVGGRATADAEADAVWVDRSGRPVPNGGDAVPMLGFGLRLSHTGRLLAFLLGRASRDRPQLWIHDVVRRVSWSLNDATGSGFSVGAFSPDDSRIVFRGISETGGTALYEQAVSGASTPRHLLTFASTEVVGIHDVTPDARSIIYSQYRSDRTGRSLRFLSLVGEPKPQTYIDLNDVRTQAAISPDGRYMAYSTVTGDQSAQVFVQPFPDAAGGKWPVSGAGAIYPRWRSDGRELYFVDGAGRLSAVPVTRSPALELGRPAVLFELPGFARRDIGYPYDVTPDGQRFIVIRPRPQASAGLTVVVNWTAALRSDADARAPQP